MKDLTFFQTCVVAIAFVAEIMVIGWGFSPPSHYEWLRGDDRSFQNFICIPIALLLMVGCSKLIGLE